ncbi:hypothetical protein BU202_08230 [Streptococcus cuniculi]|uniref:HK97 gp10 family phage protein n=1 Tax=Streptococcus cuniculi TaxID=1432788 RepID=A0A1Q8E6B3_9STRE|nr:HK97 gp10 family phage protein [Streptococcus cuniculi]OLF47304.1 hypothetical protein BU202_08230 [Streptococcus cuniculi]QBX23156.1 hypothetical protein Javan116_0027 [Streptococcus phage Javan116]
MVSTSDLSRELAKALAEYSEEVDNATDELAKATADKAVSTLKTTSPRKTSKYARHWKVTKNKKGNYVVHNAPQTYRLTHLLENSHLLRNGGRSRAQPHIAPVEEMVIKAMTEGIERVIR